MKKQSTTFIPFLLLLFPSMLYSDFFESPFAALISPDKTIIRYYILDSNVSEKTKKMRLKSKEDFARFLKKNIGHISWINRRINCISSLLKTETDRILTRGIKSFEEGFVPPNFFATKLPSDHVNLTLSLSELFKIEKSKRNKRTACELSNDTNRSIYDTNPNIFAISTNTFD